LPGWSDGSLSWTRHSAAYLRVCLTDGFHVGEIAQSAGIKFALDEVMGGENVRLDPVEGSFGALLPDLVEGHAVDVLPMSTRAGGWPI
jgi:hypothetical protein